MSSDHGNFAQAGMPAFRLVSGFDDADANTRLVLTSEYTRDQLDPEELEKAARLTHQIVMAALDADEVETARCRSMPG